MRKKLVYYENLDGLRGIAAIMVLIFHFFTYPISNYIENDIYSKITEFGQHGVSLFFVLSGFVITRILINTKENSNYFSQFYWRRILRIFPLYYGFLFFFYFLIPILLPSNQIDFVPLSNQIPFYLYIQNMDWITNLNQSGPGHYWSLAVEEHFYLIWPLVVFIIPFKKLNYLIVFLIFIIIPLKIIFLLNEIPINTNTFTRIDQILLGALLAYYEAIKAFEENRSYFQKFFSYGIVLLIPISIIIYVFQMYFPNVKEILKYNILGLLFFSIIGLLIINNKKGIHNTFLKSNILQHLGKISYGIYVWHIFVLMLLNYYLKTKIIAIDLGLSILLTIIIAHLSFYFFENKFLKYK